MTASSGGDARRELDAFGNPFWGFSPFWRKQTISPSSINYEWNRKYAGARLTVGQGAGPMFRRFPLIPLRRAQDLVVEVAMCW